MKKKKKGPKPKKVATKGRKPRYLQDEKGEKDEKQSDDGFKCGACKEVHSTVEALKGKSWKIFARKLIYKIRHGFIIQHIS